MSAREASAGDAHGGTPTRINIDVNASGQREQWVYDDGYLYLDDGVLATIQCRNIVTATPTPAPRATPALTMRRSW